MSILSGGPSAIRKLVKDLAPEMIQKIHTHYATVCSTLLEEGESNVMVGYFPHSDGVLVMCMAIHDSTGAGRIVSKQMLNELLDSIPDQDFKIALS